MHYSFTINGLEGLVGMEVDAPATINMKGGDKLVKNHKKSANFPVQSRVPAQQETWTTHCGEIQLCLGACVSHRLRRQDPLCDQPLPPRQTPAQVLHHAGGH